MHAIGTAADRQTISATPTPAAILTPLPGPEPMYYMNLAVLYRL